MQFASNKLWRVHLRVQLFVTLKYRLRSNGERKNGEEKLSNRLTAVILKDFHLERQSVVNISSYLWPRRRFCRSHFFSGWKKKTVSLMGSKCVCLCQKAVLPVFYLTHFDWISAHFRKCSDAHIIRGCFACKQLLRAEIFSLFPRPLPPSSTPTPNQT